MDLQLPNDSVWNDKYILNITDQSFKVFANLFWKCGLYYYEGGMYGVSRLKSHTIEVLFNPANNGFKLSTDIADGNDRIVSWFSDPWRVTNQFGSRVYMDNFETIFDFDRIGNKDSLVSATSDYETRVAKAYIDGNIEKTKENTTAEILASDVYNGSCSLGTGKFYCMRIYSRALTAAEIAENYAVDRARFNLT